MRPTRWPRATGLAFPAAADDAPRQQAGDLLEGDFKTRVGALAAHRDRVLLVALGRGRIHGVEKLAFLVVHTAHNAADGRAVHVDIENAEEDADALAGAFGGGDRGSFGDQPVAGRNNQSFAGGNGALRIAEKPEEKRRQQDRNQALRPETAGESQQAAATTRKTSP